MSEKKLSVEHFYAQFHNSDHHADAGEYVKPKHHLHNPELAKKHKGLDLKALRNAKRGEKFKKPVMVNKDINLMRHELMTRKGR